MTSSLAIYLVVNDVYVMAMGCLRDGVVIVQESEWIFEKEGNAMDANCWWKKMQPEGVNRLQYIVKCRAKASIRKSFNRCVREASEPQ